MKNLSRTDYAELLAVLVILVVSFWLRTYSFTADPPIGLSTSTGVYTDPPQYTLFAKQKVQTGEFNPYNDQRFVFFLKSSVTVLGYILFSLFGVSMAVSNMTGFVYAFGTLLLGFLIARKLAGRLGGVFYLLLLLTDYNQIFYSRLPFLENAMTFWGFLSICLLLYFTSRWVALGAGISLAVGIFFSKIIGLVFLAPFAVYFLYQFLYEKDQFSWKRLFYFSGGFAGIALFWLFFSYIPMKQQVASYVGEQAFSLYGAPDGLKSFSNFVWKLVSFGKDSNLFERMKLPALLGAGFLGIVFYRMLQKKSWKEGFGGFRAGDMFIFTIIVAYYFSLMIWNYRPLRYELVMIYPFYIAAAMILKMLWEKWQQTGKEKVPLHFIIFVFLLVYVAFYQMYAFYIETTIGDFYFEDYKYTTAGWSLLISALIMIWVILYKQKKMPSLQWPAKVLVVLVFILVTYKGYLDYSFWFKRASFSSEESSIDLGKILGPGAVLSGPYAPYLTLENNLGTVIHMFGVSSPDPDLFKKYPVTHLLVDSGNESRAKEDYPDIMESATHLLTYHLADQKIRLYRIAGHTGNESANRYRLSMFERLLDEYDDGNGQLNNQLAIEFLQRYPENSSCYQFLGEAAEIDSLYPIAETMFKKAVEFSPTNYHLTARLGKFYEDRYTESKNVRYLEQAIYYYDQALLVYPTNFKIQSARDALEKIQ